MRMMSLPQERGKVPGDPYPTCFRGLDILQDELDAAVQHLDGAMLCYQVFSHYRGTGAGHC